MIVCDCVCVFVCMCFVLCFGPCTLEYRAQKKSSQKVCKQFANHPRGKHLTFSYVLDHGSQKVRKQFAKTKTQFAKSMQNACRKYAKQTGKICKKFAKQFAQSSQPNFAYVLHTPARTVFCYVLVAVRKQFVNSS